MEYLVRGALKKNGQIAEYNKIMEEIKRKLNYTFDRGGLSHSTLEKNLNGISECYFQQTNKKVVLFINISIFQQKKRNRFLM